MNSKNNSNDFDKRLDELLAARPVRANEDFAKGVFDRLYAKGELDEAQLDALLTEMPVTPSADFTASVLRRTHRAHRVVSFLRPVMAAAASVVISLGGIWIVEQDSTPAEPAPAFAGSAQVEDSSADIYTLAADLSYAGPLLDTQNVESLTQIVKSYE